MKPRFLWYNMTADQQMEETVLKLAHLKTILLDAGINVSMHSTFLGNGKPPVNGCYPGTDYENTAMTYKKNMSVHWNGGTECYHLCAHGWYSRMVPEKDIRQVVDLLLSYVDDFMWYDKHGFRV